MIAGLTKWDVCIADVPFEDLPKSKIRPVLILGENDTVSIDCLKMTSKPPRDGEYALMKWSEAGLRKETTVRIGKRLDLACDSIKKKLDILIKLTF